MRFSSLHPPCPAIIQRCASASTPGSCTISGSAPTSETCIRQLARLDSRNEFVLLCRPDDAAGLTTIGENFRPVVETAGNYSVAEQWKVPLALVREGVTLFHAPHYVLPPLVRCSSVVTIHDCIHLMFPQYLPNRLALRVRTHLDSAGRAARDAGSHGV